MEKAYCPVNLLSVVSKIFEKLVHNWLVDHFKKCVFLLIFSLVSGLLDKLQMLKIQSLLQV